MSQNYPSPDWSLDDARTARLEADRRHAETNRGTSAIFAKLQVHLDRIAATALGPAIYQPRLERVSRHMNRNQDAFGNYSPCAEDVVVSAYFKAGTNWIMHCCHQICHFGQAEFDHIQDVIPWPDAAEPRFWVHVNAPAPFDSPSGKRVIKSHLPASKLPIDSPAKFIAVTRDPKDCAASAFHFFRDLFYGPSMPPPDVWLRFFMSETPNFGRWDTFTASWHNVRDRPNVLFLTFEEVKADNRAALRRIAEFMEVALTEAQLNRVSKMTSFEAMKTINHKFYPARQSARTNPKGQMIRSGKIGGARGLFSTQALADFDQNWLQGLNRLNSDFPYSDLYVQHMETKDE